MNELPPGQHIAPWQRFGLPQFAPITPRVPGRPVLYVGGTVRAPAQIELSTLFSENQRQEQTSDLHCVTTWSVIGTLWSGVPFHAVHQQLARQVQPHPDCVWIVITGLDGYRACLRLDDALSPNVLLADRLDGAELTVDNGAPARLVTPDHYGYKWVRGVCAIEYRKRYEPGSAAWMAHPRGRVAREERSRLLPGWLWRRVWRRLLPRVRRRYDDAGSTSSTKTPPASLG